MKQPDMLRPSRAAAVARLPMRTRLAFCAAGLASILLLLATHAMATAFAAKDSDLVGKWSSDAKDPAAQYEVVAGAKPGELRLMTPKALKLQPIALRRTAPNTFSSLAGASPITNIKLTDARHGRLSLHKDDNTGVMFTYVLIQKQ